MERKYNELKTLSEYLETMESVPLVFRGKCHDDLARVVRLYISDVNRGIELIQQPFSEDVAKEVESLMAGFVYDKGAGFGVYAHQPRFRDLQCKVLRYLKFLGYGHSGFSANIANASVQETFFPGLL